MVRHLSRLISLFVLCLLFSCASKPTGKRADDSAEQPIKPASVFEQLTFKSDGRTVFEDDGNFILIEGSKCVQRDHGAEPAVATQWIEMPGYVDRGTVVLNGWDLRFLQHDREVNSLRADIARSKLVKNNASTFLVFEAHGKLDDQERKDAFEFCVFYSAFGYRVAAVEAEIEGDDGGIETAVAHSKHKGAVATMEYVGAKGTLKGNETMAVIPRAALIFSSTIPLNANCGLFHANGRIVPITGCCRQLTICRKPEPRRLLTAPRIGLCKPFSNQTTFSRTESKRAWRSFAVAA